MKSSYLVVAYIPGGFTVPSPFETLKRADSSAQNFSFYGDYPVWVFEVNSKLVFNGRCMIREYISDIYLKNNPDFNKKEVLEKLYNTVDNFIHGLLII